jgi:hypothetical protein
MGDFMKHTCAICKETFGVWVLYRMHEASFHMVAPVSLPGVKHPMTREAKAFIVSRGEARLGAYNFFGGSI